MYLSRNLSGEKPPESARVVSNVPFEILRNTACIVVAVVPTASLHCRLFFFVVVVRVRLPRFWREGEHRAYPEGEEHRRSVRGDGGTRDGSPVVHGEEERLL